MSGVCSWRQDEKSKVQSGPKTNQTIAQPLPMRNHSWSSSASGLSLTIAINTASRAKVIAIAARQRTHSLALVCTTDGITVEDLEAVELHVVLQLFHV